MLRRALGRLRIDDDTIRHLTTFQRLGETFEVQMPTEVLPVGARTVARALRTRAAANVGEGWVWPHWLDRQLDPTAPEFIPRGHLPLLSNVTGRNWTMVGNVDSPWEAIVDQRGLVVPWIDGWSLDWWVGADDRWHFPSREVTVRQSLLGGAPVVETRMRVPGGDAVHRVYCSRTDAGDGRRELIHVEIENDSPNPFALALAVRPYNTEGLSVIERIDLDDTIVSVDGRVALLFATQPARVAASTLIDGDCVSTVTSGDAGDSFPQDLRDEAGMAQAAFLFPLAHRAMMRIAIPIEPAPRTTRRGRRRRRVADAVGHPASVPSAEQVANGWRSQIERGARFVVPDERMQAALDANQAYQLLFHDPDDITPGPTTYHRFWFRDAAYQLAALDRFGFHDEAAQVIATYPDRQKADGFFFSQRSEWDANGAALWTMAHHWELTRDEAMLEGLEPTLARGIQWIEHKRHVEPRRRDERLEGLLPAGISAEHLGPFDYFYWDDFWSLAGLRSGATLLEALGEDTAAADARNMFASMEADVLRSLEHTAAHLGTAAIPAGPRRRIDPGAIGSLVACTPLGLLAADHPGIAATAEVIRERFCQGDAFYQAISHTGLGTYLTLQLAAVELAAGDRRALDRLDWMLDAATPTWTWPEAIHPRLGGGCMGDGHHGWASAEFLNLVRSMLVDEGESSLRLCSMLPASWLGQGIEVHDAPTRLGKMSFAVRWHGARPALLWEFEPHDGVGPVELTAPGLDPNWRTTDLRGDALLEAPEGSERSAASFS